MANSSRDPTGRRRCGARSSIIQRRPTRSKTNAPSATCRCRGRRRRRERATGRVFAHLPFGAGHGRSDGSPPMACRARCATRSPPTARHAPELHRRVRRCRTRRRGERQVFGPYPGRPGRHDDHAVGDRIRPDRVDAHPAVRDVRHLPHALYEGAWTERRGDRRAPGAGAVSRVAAQRVPRGAELSVVPHAGRDRADAHRVGARRAARRASRDTRSAAATSSCCACSTATAPSSASRHCRRSSRRRLARHDRATAAARPPRSRSTRAERSGGRLVVDVTVRNLTGHKLPTAYPSRRVWLHVTVRDRDGRVVFESGAVEPAGLDPRQRQRRRPSARRAALHARSRAPNEVQIYESIMVDAAGADHDRTAEGDGLRQGQPAAAARLRQGDGRDDIAVHGAATTDSDFTAGGDRVRYVVATAAAARPLHRGRGAELPADRVSVGAEPEELRRP